MWKHSIGGFYAGCTLRGAELLQSNSDSTLSSLISTALPLGVSDIDIDDISTIGETNIAMIMLRNQECLGLEGLPITVIGSCCRQNDRVNVSKQNALKVGKATQVFPSTTKSIGVPVSWNNIFGENIL